MVDINTQENKVRVNVFTGGTKVNANAQYPSTYYDTMAKQWAVGEGIIDGTDYSSKHYAEVSKENALLSGQAKDEAQVLRDTAETVISSTKDSAITSITETKDLGVGEITTAKITGIEELTTTKTTAVNEITTAKNNGISEIQSEGTTQVNNIRSTGFYLRDDELYFINSQGQEEQFDRGYKPPLLSTLWSDHLINDIQWLLEGLLVLKNMNLFEKLHSFLI